MYPSVEHAFHAAKTLNREYKIKIANIPTPSHAKRIGKILDIRSDWEEVKIQIMTEIVHCKFTQNPILKKRLLNTGNAELIEGNTWNDTFWGVCRGKGENWLGKILMQVREELRS